MRWNGVFVLGLGLVATGFLAAAFVKLAGFTPEAGARAMALSISVLACGALTACLGSIMSRRQNDPVYRYPKRQRLFKGDPSNNGTRTRNFGQRAEYSALGRKPQRDDATKSDPRLSITYQGPK